jgi:hypothetical protein
MPINLDYNQLLNQMSSPIRGTMSPFGQGQVAQGIADQTMNAFGNAAALSSANRQAAYPFEAQMMIEQEKSGRLNQLLNSPLLARLLGGGAGGFTSNFGQGIGGPPQPAPATPTPPPRVPLDPAHNRPNRRQHGAPY